MFFINLIIVLIAGYFAYGDYKKERIGWAMFWSAVTSWNLHNFLGNI